MNKQQKKSPVEAESDRVFAVGSKKHGTLGTSVLYMLITHLKSLV